MTSGPATANVPGERLIERAMVLLIDVDMASGEDAQCAQATLARWQERSPEHAAAVLEARKRWEALGSMAGDLRTRFDPPATTAAGQQSARRTLLLSVIGLLGSGVAAAGATHWYRQRAVFHARYRTRTGQTLKVTLADAADGAPGSQVDLAPDSDVGVTLYRQRRDIGMTRGHARFDVARDLARPFRILTRDADIEVIGTALTVRDRGGATRVGVERGHVRVKLRAPADAAAGEPIDLHRSDLLEIQHGRVVSLRQTDTGALSAWRSGWLVFDNVPLGEALADVNGYRNQPIVAADPRVNAMRLSGRFRANDSAGLLAVLPTILPLSVHTLPDGSIQLHVR